MDRKRQQVAVSHFITQFIITGRLNYYTLRRESSVAVILSALASPSNQVWHKL